MSESESGVIEGRNEVSDALQQLLIASANAGVREMRLFDADFIDWPLDAPGVRESLVRWAKPGGRMLYMIAHDFEGLARKHPRFATWRRDFAHCFEALQPPERSSNDLPTMLWAGMQGIQVLDKERGRARLLREPGELWALREEFEAIAQRCELAWPSTTLGL